MGESASTHDPSTHCLLCCTVYVAAAVAINATVGGVIRTWVLTPPQSDALTTRPLRPAESLQTAELRVCIDPPRVTALTLPARCRALPPPADMDRKAAAIDGTQGQIDGRTPER